MTILIDTSFLVALASPKDSNHAQARQLIDATQEELVIPAPVLPELFDMVAIRVNYSSAIRVFDYLQSSYQIEALTVEDRARMSAIMKQYLSARFDFVDTAIMALAERLTITRVFTFDHRDFVIFRPAHCPI